MYKTSTNHAHKRMLTPAGMSNACTEQAGSLRHAESKHAQDKHKARTQPQAHARAGTTKRMQNTRNEHAERLQTARASTRGKSAFPSIPYCREADRRAPPCTRGRASHLAAAVGHIVAHHLRDSGHTFYRESMLVLGQSRRYVQAHACARTHKHPRTHPPHPRGRSHTNIAQT